MTKNGKLIGLRDDYFSDKTVYGDNPEVCTPEDDGLIEFLLAADPEEDEPGYRPDLSNKDASKPAAFRNPAEIIIEPPVELSKKEIPARKFTYRPDRELVQIANYFYDPGIIVNRKLSLRDRAISFYKEYLDPKTTRPLASIDELISLGENTLDWYLSPVFGCTDRDVKNRGYVLGSLKYLDSALTQALGAILDKNSSYKDVVDHLLPASDFLDALSLRYGLFYKEVPFDLAEKSHNLAKNIDQLTKETSPEYAIHSGTSPKELEDLAMLIVYQSEYVVQRSLMFIVNSAEEKMHFGSPRFELIFNDSEDSEELPEHLKDKEYSVPAGIIYI